MTKTTKNKILAALHEAMADSHEVGVVDQKALRDFDASGLMPALKRTAKDMVALRLALIEGEQSGPSGPLDVNAFIAGKKERTKRTPAS